MELHLNDIQLFEASSILFSVSKEFNVSGNYMHIILSALYFQVGALSSDKKQKAKITKENPILPEIIEENSIQSNCISEILNVGLLEKVEKGYALTQKSIAILNRTSRMQKELKKKGLPFYPQNYSL